MIQRSIEPLLQEALSITPVVLLSGARQIGKSTLAISLDREYRVFDSVSDREAATSDNLGYIRTLPKPVTIDEIQKVPQVLESIKLEVDKNRVNGSFLLTGSANLLDMKKTKDSLAGRIIELPMFGFSQKEIENKPFENLIDIFFQNKREKIQVDKVAHEKIYEAILRGGYPEIQKIQSARMRSLWFDSYISTYIERDIRDIAELRDITAFIKFFNILAPRSCSLLNKSELANEASLAEATVSNYLSMLEMVYQIKLLRAYSSNISKRFVKSPKMYMCDSGIFCHLLGISTKDQLSTTPYKGTIVETFVLSELLKHISYSEVRPMLYHYRTSDKKEIDFIVEKGEIILAIEVKSSQTAKKEDFKHIKDFQRKTSSKKVIGIIFYMGENILSFGDNEHQRLSIPISVFF